MPVLSDLGDKDARRAAIRSQQVDMPATPISSSEIQRRIAAGEPWRELTPAAVARYIVAHGLYGASRAPSGVITLLVKKSQATSVFRCSRMNFRQTVSSAHPRR